MGDDDDRRREDKDGMPDANITYLAEKPEIDTARQRARSTRENVEKAFADLAAKRSRTTKSSSC